MNYLPAICFAIIPFWVCGENVFYGHINALVLSAVLMMFLCNQGKYCELNKWIKVFGAYLVLWMAYSFLMAFAGKFPVTLFGEIVITAMFILCGLVFFIAVCRSETSFNFWANTICCVATLQAILGILQYAGLDPVLLLLSKIVDVHSQMGFNVPAGTLGNPNFLAAFLVISLPMFFRFEWRITEWKYLMLPVGWILAIPVILVALLLTKTTAAIGAGIIGLAFYWGGWQAAFLGFIPAFSIYAIKYHETLFTNERFQYWQNAWESTSSSWQTLLFGWGPGITWQPGNMLHSEYASMFFNFGIVGVVLLLLYIFGVIRKGGNRLLQTSTVIIAVNIIGNHAFHLAATASLIIVIFALIEREQIV